ncbi:MAG: hypothetical protein HY720_12990 [Planctomycetes bacterium]|nr:hypothetical protein [Planctomycetota bacterium]
MSKVFAAALAAAVLALAAGCYEPRYDWDSPAREEWQESSGILRDPYWQEGDELLAIEKIEILVPSGTPGQAPARQFAGLVKFVRMRGENEGHVVRLVEDRRFRLTGVILPDGKTLRFTDDGGSREVGFFGYSNRAQYHFAIKNILNIDAEIDTRPFDGTFEEE